MLITKQDVLAYILEHSPYATAPRAIASVRETLKSKAEYLSIGVDSPLIHSLLRIHKTNYITALPVALAEKRQHIVLRSQII